MFRELGKAVRDLWAASVVLIVVVGQFTNAFAGSWTETAFSLVGLLLFVWLILFAIGVSRGEPNP